MPDEDVPIEEVEKTIEGFSDTPRGEKMMHAVVMTAGPGTRMLELTRSGPGRKGVSVWVDGNAVVWLTTDRSALMPVIPGVKTASYRASTPGKSWRLRTTKPAGATGGTSGSGPKIGQFRIVVP
ncbi:MAG: hypothetical protein GY719_11250 [bacterium]|nr:hypothetical protein [bacterium]